MIGIYAVVHHPGLGYTMHYNLDRTRLVVRLQAETNPEIAVINLTICVNCNDCVSLIKSGMFMS